MKTIEVAQREYFDTRTKKVAIEYRVTKAVDTIKWKIGMILDERELGVIIANKLAKVIITEKK